MSKEEIVEANKMFAEYLGYKYYPKIDGEQNPGWRKEVVLKGHGYLCRTHNQLPFYNDWNWMMKINVKLTLDLYSSYQEPNINFKLYKLNVMNGDLKEAFKELYKYFKTNNYAKD